MSKKASKKKINKTALEMIMVKFLTNEEQIKALEQDNLEYKKEIFDQLVESGESKYLLEIDPVESDYKQKISCSFIIATKAKVVYNIAKVKEVLGKELFNKIVIRNIDVDYEKFVGLAKKYKIPQKEAMSCLTISESINNDKLQKLHDTGEIDINKLKGTFTIDKSLYLTHRRMK